LALLAIQPLNFEFQKDGGRPPGLKIVKSHYLSKGLTGYHKICDEDGMHVPIGTIVAVVNSDKK